MGAAFSGESTNGIACSETSELTGGITPQTVSTIPEYVTGPQQSEVFRIQLSAGTTRKKGGVPHGGMLDV